MSLNQTFALLARLPLLQGLGSRELAQLESRMEMELMPAQRRPIIVQGEPCSQLLFLVEGQLMRSYQSPDGKYGTRQTLDAPAAIEPEALYALGGTYRHSYRTLTECRFINIRRGDVTTRLMTLDIFRINYINLLSRQLQRLQEQLVPRQYESLEDRLLHFIASIFPYGTKDAMLEMRMQDMADYLNAARLNVSRVLNRLQQQGLLQLGRGKIRFTKELKN